MPNVSYIDYRYIVNFSFGNFDLIGFIQGDFYRFLLIISVVSLKM
jgi:hypothetical protein